jgi:ribosomal protein L11 methyltransferase
MTEKSWQKISIHCPSMTCESVASFISDLTGSGVEIADDKDSDDHSYIYGYLATDDPSLPDKMAATRTYLDEINRQFPEYSAATMEAESIADQDWHQKWKATFKPFKLSENIVIKPSWETYTPTGAEKVIEIDPGMAFGTGLHASTKLATLLMEEYLATLPAPPRSVLDVGTGTGILAIAAALLGCREVTAIDNDPEAVAAARDNIKSNGLNNISASSTDLADLDGTYDLILANIIHNTLVEMAPVLTSLLADNGILILAGILSGSQADNIISIYSGLGLKSLSSHESGEWAALSFKKDMD